MSAAKSGGIPAADKFINGFDKAKTSWSLANSKEVEDCLKEMTKDCAAGNRANYSEFSNRGVFSRIGSILESGGKGGENMKLGTLMISIFQFLNEVLLEGEIPEILRDEYGILPYLSQIFDPLLPPEEIELLLNCVELLTRSFVVAWKAPYLKLLVQKTITYLTANFFPSRQTYLGFQFLVNICRKNPCCVIIVRFDPSYRQFWKQLGQGMTQDTDHKTNILISHLILLLNTSVHSDTFSSACQLVTDWTDRVLKDPELLYSHRGPETISNVCGGIIQISELLQTITEKMKPIYEPISEEGHILAGAGQASSTNGTKVLSSSAGSSGFNTGNLDTIRRTKDIFLNTLLSMLKKLQDFVSQFPKAEKGIGEAVLQYVQVLLPAYIPVSVLLDSYKVAIRITEHLMEDTKIPSPEFICCLTVYLHIIQQVVESKDRQATLSTLREFDPCLQKLMSKIQLTTDMAPASVQLNSLFIRLLSYMSSCPGFSEEVLKKLDLGLIHSLVKNLTAADDSIVEKEKWQRSVCAVELLSTMSKFSTNNHMLSLLLTLVGNPDVAYHIASCIQKGDERAIRNALTVTGSTAFADNTLTVITKSITAMRQQGGSVPKVEPPSCGLSSSAVKGAIILNQTLKSIDDVRENVLVDEVPLFGDLISWYKMKQEMHEHELLVINAHVYHLNQTITHLKTLLEKQSEFASKRIFTNDQKDWEVISLRKKLDNASKETTTHIVKLEKDIGLLKQNVEAQAVREKELKEIVRNCEGKIAMLQDEISAEQKARLEVQAKLKVSLHEIRSLKKDLTRNRTELDDMGKKVSFYETALKQKDEEKANADMLLEKEKKMLDTIRGLVGNNFGNLGHHGT